MLQKLQVNLSEKINLTHDVMLLKFKTNNGLAEAIPGQYMIVFVPNGEFPYRRLYSIASDCGNLETFDLVAKIIPGGVASEYFKKLQVGDEIHVEGPAGVFHLKKNDRDKLFLATGTGIAPIYTMVNELLCKDPKFTKQIKLFWGLRTYKDVYFLEEFKKIIAENSNFDFAICLSREENLDMIPEEDRKYFHTGRITKLVEANNVIENKDIYLCGDRTVVESIRQYLYNQGIDKESVIFEKF